MKLQKTDDIYQKKVLKQRVDQIKEQTVRKRKESKCQKIEIITEDIRNNVDHGGEIWE